MRFTNRTDAATRLVAPLRKYAARHPLVLGLPRGGVPMARVVADALEADLDVALVRKIGAPGQPELAIGAVDEHGTVVEGAYFGVASADYVRRAADAAMALMRERRARYTAARPPVDPAGRVVILVDDGVATGATMVAALRATRARGPALLVVATPVAAPSALDAVRREADEVVCLTAPAAFGAVGQFFDDFSQVSDDDVVEALSRPPRAGD